MFDSIRIAAGVRRAAGAAALALGLLSAPVASAAYNQSLTRSIDAGQLYGKVAASNTHAFLGIPFAQAAGGRPALARTAAAAALERLARRHHALPPMCAQIGSFFGEPDPATFGQPVGSEDCLYLNVWRPNSTADNLPVFYWIHGGSNIKGSTREPLYDGAYLASKGNMVVVSVQYRLGMLGFLNHSALKTGNAKDDSGNYATLDLIRGLDWVQTNIRAFGGNPGQVTVAGQSAGCINTWGLLQSPLAANKMHRAICMSGIPNAYPPLVGQLAADTLIDKLLVDTGRASDAVQAAAQRAHDEQRADRRRAAQRHGRADHEVHAQPDRAGALHRRHGDPKQWSRRPGRRQLQPHAADDRQHPRRRLVLRLLARHGPAHAAAVLGPRQRPGQRGHASTT